MAHKKDGERKRLDPEQAPAALLGVEPWEQQPDETAAEYEKFAKYRDMDPVERSIHGSYRALQGRAGDMTVRAPGSYWQLAQDRKWEERARLYDLEGDRKLRAALERRKLKSLTEIADLGETLRTKAFQAARMLSGITQSIGERDGREVILVEVKLTPSEIARLAQVGTELEQLAIGEPTSRQEIMGDLTIEMEDAREVLERRLAEINARKAKARELGIETNDDA